MEIKVSVPGSIMLMGEHAVLQGKQAIVCAVNRRMQVRLVPRLDRQICIRSQQMGECVIDANDISIQPPFEFITAACKAVQQQVPTRSFPGGFDLYIDSEFSEQLGLGSSSAVTVGTLAVLSEWLDFSWSLDQLYQVAKEVICEVQGAGSGADVAASVFGGILTYQLNPTQPTTAVIQSLTQVFPSLCLVYSGSKMATKLVIAEVAKRQAQFPELFAQLFTSIDQCSAAACLAIREQNWQSLGALMNIHQGLQDSLGVSNQILHDIIVKLRAQSTIMGAKISGSGLGDCVVGMGEIDSTLFAQDAYQRQGVQQIPIEISPQGLLIDRPL